MGPGNTLDAQTVLDILPIGARKVVKDILIFLITLRTLPLSYFFFYKSCSLYLYIQRLCTEYITILPHRYIFLAFVFHLSKICIETIIINILH